MPPLRLPSGAHDAARAYTQSDLPQNLWNDEDARGLSALEILAYRSRLLAADRSVVNIFGGNTSAKAVETDHLGRPVNVLWVKGSACGGIRRGLPPHAGESEGGVAGSPRLCLTLVILSEAKNLNSRQTEALWGHRGRAFGGFAGA